MASPRGGSPVNDGSKRAEEGCHGRGEIRAPRWCAHWALMHSLLRSRLGDVFGGPRNRGAQQPCPHQNRIQFSERIGVAAARPMVEKNGPFAVRDCAVCLLASALSLISRSLNKKLNQGSVDRDTRAGNPNRHSHGRVRNSPARNLCEAR